MAKDRLNEIMYNSDDENVCKYIMSTLTEFSYELNSVKMMAGSGLMVKLYKLLLKSRELSINSSTIPVEAKTHLLCVVQTICKERIRELNPRFTVIGDDLKPMTKRWLRTTGLAEQKKKKWICRNGLVECQIVSWNELKALQYERKRMAK